MFAAYTPPSNEREKAYQAGYAAGAEEAWFQADQVIAKLKRRVEYIRQRCDQQARRLANAGLFERED
jgi:hypothetical protein